MRNSRTEIMTRHFGLTIILFLTLNFVFGQHDLYNKNKQISKSGTFKDNRLWDGKNYIYDKDNTLVKIEFFKDGEFVRDSIIPLQKKQRDDGVVYYEKVSRIDTSEIYILVDSTAKYKNGFPDLMKYIMKNFIYPKDQEVLQTKSTVKFVVDRRGIISNVVIYNKPTDKYTLFDKEMLRVFTTMPPWTPAIKKGIIVKQEFTIPVQLEIK